MPELQDFTTYIEVDPGADISKTAARITWASMPNTVESYVYKDMTAGFFSGDFAFTMAINQSVATNGGRVGHWAVANAVDSRRGLFDANESYIVVTSRQTASSPTNKIGILEGDSGSEFLSSEIAIDKGTVYYLLITRDESAGTYGTMTLSVYTDEARTSLVGSVAHLLHSSKKDYRYLYGCQATEFGGGGLISGHTENMKMSNLSTVPVIVYPEERDVGGGVHRVTSLVHVYDRVQNIYDLEFQLGEVSADKMPLVEGVIAEIPPPPVGPTGLPALAPPGVMGITDPNIAIPPFVLPSVPRPDGSKPTIPGLPRPFPDLPPIEKPGQIPRLEPKEGLPGLLRPFPELPPIEKPGMVPKFEAPFSKRGRGLSGVETPQERRARLLGRVGIGTATPPTGGETEQEKRARLLSEIGIGG
ncbi:hypothetical protein LCGC14_0316340 [marine sediment metagenome]|uniref:Uncharacterized protein n=1 Tax=marine sediment metagenome TaxID=412755 RepID=A0A0F9U333_9ZZZZ